MCTGLVCVHTPDHYEAASVHPESSKVEIRRRRKLPASSGTCSCLLLLRRNCQAVRKVPGLKQHLKTLKLLPVAYCVAVRDRQSNMLVVLSHVHEPTGQSIRARLGLSLLKIFTTTVFCLHLKSGRPLLPSECVMNAAVAAALPGGHMS